MKKFVCFLLLFATACSKAVDNNDVSQDLVSLTRTITPHVTPYIDWEDTTKINIVGHGLVTLPWYNGAEGMIPEHILQDYTRADGWELVYNFCSDEQENSEGNKNYLIFYNKLTGKLRVFYYSKDIVTTGTTTIAQFRTSHPTRLFNFNTGFYSEPYRTINKLQQICVSNTTTTDNRATVLGWNCFEVELAYEPAIADEYLHIDFFDQDIIKLKLQGILDMDTNGTIITTEISNPFTPLLSLAGDAAGKALQDAYEKKKNKDKSSSSTRALNFGAALGKLGGKIVSTGLNAIFGSFLGRFDKTTETQSTIELKTQGTANFSGEGVKTIASAIPSIQNLRFPGSTATETDHIIPLYNEPLGTWTIENVPEIKLDMELTPIVYPVTPQPINSQDYCVDYQRSLRRGIFSKEHIIINPETQACISDYEAWVDYYVIVKYDGKSYTESGGNYNQYLTKCVYEERYDENKKDESYINDYKHVKTMFYELHPYIAEQHVSKPNLAHHSFPSWMSQDEILRQLQWKVEYKQPFSQTYTNIIAKISVIFYPKPPYNDKPILSTKTFKVGNTSSIPVEHKPIYIYNPYVKPDPISKQELWDNRWNWSN